MEGDRILMAAGVTVAAVVGAFVFFGPNGLYKKNRLLNSCVCSVAMTKIQIYFRIIAITTAKGTNCWTT